MQHEALPCVAARVEVGGDATYTVDGTSVDTAFRVVVLDVELVLYGDADDLDDGGMQLSDYSCGRSLIRLRKGLGVEAYLAMLEAMALDLLLRWGVGFWWPTTFNMRWQDSKGPRNSRD
jgi:hypothetical protein